MNLFSGLFRHVQVLFVVTLISLLVIPYFASAQTVLRTEDTVSVATDQVVDGDFYSFGSRIRVLGEVTGDWIAVGADVSGSGEFQDDIFLLADSAQVNGSTTNSVRAVGREVVIAGYVGGNLAIIGGSVEILSSAQIEGDVLMFANDVTVSGPVDGDILGRYGSLRIDSSVGGDVDIRVQELTLGNQTSIAGSLTYESPRELVRAQDAIVEGDIGYREITSEFSWQEQVQSALMPTLVLIFATLTFFLIQRRRFDAVVEHTLERPLLFSLIGLIFMLLAPPLIFIFLASILGSVVGLALAGLYLLLVVLAVILTIPVLGAFICRAALGRAQIDLLTLCLGALVVYGLFIVPFIGIPAFLVVLFITLGGFVTWLYQR